MASPATPDPTQGGAPSPDSGGGAPSGAPASPEMMMLSKLYQACQGLARQNPILSAGLTKAAEGIQEAQTALVSQPTPQPASSNPPV